MDEHCTKDQVMQWTEDQVAQWLRSLGGSLSDVADRFMEEGINGEALFELDEANLTEMKLKIGQKKILLKRIREIQGPPPANTMSAPNVSLSGQPIASQSAYPELVGPNPVGSRVPASSGVAHISSENPFPSGPASSHPGAQAAEHKIKHLKEEMLKAAKETRYADAAAIKASLDSLQAQSCAPMPPQEPDFPTGFDKRAPTGFVGRSEPESQASFGSAIHEASRVPYAQQARDLDDATKKRVQNLLVEGKVKDEVVSLVGDNPNLQKLVEEYCEKFIQNDPWYKEDTRFKAMLAELAKKAQAADFADKVQMDEAKTFCESKICQLKEAYRKQIDGIAGAEEEVQRLAEELEQKLDKLLHPPSRLPPPTNGIVSLGQLPHPHRQPTISQYPPNQLNQCRPEEVPTGAPIPPQIGTPVPITGTPTPPPTGAPVPLTGTPIPPPTGTPVPLTGTPNPTGPLGGSRR